MHRRGPWATKHSSLSAKRSRSGRALSTTGARATFEGNRFHLGEKKFGAENLELAYSTATVGPKLTFSASDWIHFDVYAAGAVYRRYEVFRDDESVSKAKLAPVVAYGARFWIGPSQWETKKTEEK